MERNLYSFVAGAGVVTLFVVFSGGYSFTLFSLGFISAAVLAVVFARAIGAARLAAWLGKVAEVSQTTAAPNRPRTRAAAVSRDLPQGVAAVAPMTAIERDVISALINLGTKRKDAAEAVSKARAAAAAEFEPLLKAALDIIAGRKVA